MSATAPVYDVTQPDQRDAVVECLSIRLVTINADRHQNSRACQPQYFASQVSSEYRVLELHRVGHCSTSRWTTHAVTVKPSSAARAAPILGSRPSNSQKGATVLRPLLSPSSHSEAWTSFVDVVGGRSAAQTGNGSVGVARVAALPHVRQQLRPRHDV